MAGRQIFFTMRPLRLTHQRTKSDALNAMTKAIKKTNHPDAQTPVHKGASIRLTPELRKALGQAVACCREIAGVGQREGSTLSDYEVDSLAAANEIERLLEGRRK